MSTHDTPEQACIHDAVSLDVAAAGFGALGSEARLEVLLILVRAGTNGLSVGEIQTRCGFAPSTLQHHLKFLASAGLIRQEKIGRIVTSYAEFSHLESLASYILSQCCADAVDQKGEAA